MEFRDVAERICGDIVLAEDHGSAMKKWRQLFRLTQTEIARRLGVVPSVISDYENSRRTPGVNFVKRFVEALIEADAERGYEVLSKYRQIFEVGSAIVDIAEYSKPCTVEEFGEVIEAERLNDYFRNINGHTVIDSIKAILEMSAFDFYRLYGLTSERAMIFLGVTTGRSPMVAVRVSNLKPAAVVLHGLRAESVDRVARMIAEIEKLPLLVTSLEVEEMVSRLREVFV
ncbi:MAG: helix-turn-helix domain-containing protein [Archaeoglobaceae archaeon]